jgi:hypothetical protein
MGSYCCKAGSEGIDEIKIDHKISEIRMNTSHEENEEQVETNKSRLWNFDKKHRH